MTNQGHGGNHLWVKGLDSRLQTIRRALIYDLQKYGRRGKKKKSHLFFFQQKFEISHRRSLFFSLHFLVVIQTKFMPSSTEMPDKLNFPNTINNRHCVCSVQILRGLSSWDERLFFLEFQAEKNILFE